VSDAAASLPIEAPPRDISGSAQGMIFQRLRVNLLRNHTRNVVFSSSIRIVTIVVLSVLIWSCIFGLSLYGFNALKNLEVQQRLPFLEDILGTLFDLLFLALALMLIFSGGIILYSSMFTTAETTFLLSTPARADQIFAYKFQGAIAFSSWAFVLLGSPVPIAYGIIFGAKWYFYALLPLFSLGFVLVPGSIAALACLIVVNLMPRFISVPYLRKRAIIGTVATVLLAIPAYGYHLVRTAQTIHWTHDAAKEILNEFSFAQSMMTPSHWMSLGLQAAKRGDMKQATYRLALVTSNGLFLYLVTAWLAGRFYRRGYNLLATGGDSKPNSRATANILDRSLIALLRFLDPQTRHLIVKDFRTFRRDPAQWAQVAIFLVLIMLYFANMRRFYTENLSADNLGRIYQNGVSLINLGATALLLCSYTGRFIYPMLSLEGRKFWILGLLPLQRERLLWGKFAFSATWSLLASEALITISDAMLGMPVAVIGIHALTVAVASFGLSGISVGLGAVMPNFRESDPSKIAVGFGGTLNLVACLLFLLVVLLLMAGPTHLRLAYNDATNQVHGVDAWTFLGLLAGLAAGIAAVIVPMRMGARTLQQMEF
jgi:ABC-2 type transport system permease protein